jgi:hypothetical protein
MTGTELTLVQMEAAGMKPREKTALAQTLAAGRNPERGRRGDFQQKTDAIRMADSTRHESHR